MKCYSYLSILALCSLLAGCTCSKKHHKEHKPTTRENVITESKEIGNDVKEIGVEDIEPVTDIDIIDIPEDTVVEVIEEDIIPYYEEEEEFTVITDEQNNDDEFQ